MVNGLAVGRTIGPVLEVQQVVLNSRFRPKTSLRLRNLVQPETLPCKTAEFSF